MATKRVSSKSVKQQQSRERGRRKGLKQAGSQKAVEARARRAFDHNSRLSVEQEERISGAVTRALKLNGLKPSDFSPDALVYLRALGRHEFKTGLRSSGGDKTMVTSLDLARSHMTLFFDRVVRPGSTMTYGPPVLGPTEPEKWLAARRKSPNPGRLKPFIRNRPGQFTFSEADMVLFTLQDEIAAIFQRSRKGRKGRK